MIPFFLGACESSNTEKAMQLYLPDVVEYTKEQQHQVLEEITTDDDPPKCRVPMVCEFLKDYKVMRDQTRAARKRI